MMKLLIARCTDRKCLWSFPTTFLMWSVSCTSGSSSYSNRDHGTLIVYAKGVHSEGDITIRSWLYPFSHWFIVHRWDKKSWRLSSIKRYAILLNTFSFFRTWKPRTTPWRVRTSVFWDTSTILVPSRWRKTSRTSNAGGNGEFRP